MVNLVLEIVAELGGVGDGVDTLSRVEHGIVTFAEWPGVVGE